MSLDLLTVDAELSEGDHVDAGLSREDVEYGSVPGRRALSRDRRYARRYRARGLSKFVGSVDGESRFAAVETCGWHLGEEGLVEIKEHEGVCYASGGNVASCGLIWVCAVCSAKIRARREVELEAACAEWVSRGGSLAMLTFTVRHDESMSLDEVLNALNGSYRALRHRRSFEKVRALCVGQVRALEVTYGAKGWHPHLHVLLFVAPGATESEVQDVLPSMVTDWRCLVGSRLPGVLPPSVERSIDLVWFGADASSAAGYVSKVAKEISLADSKSGLDPFALLDVEDVGRDRAVARFIEYVKTMRGRHAMDWSPGLRDLLGLGVEKSDEEVVGDDDDLGDAIVGVVFARQWNRYMREGTAQRVLRWHERWFESVRRE